jgi:hypothetical protein
MKRRAFLGFLGGAAIAGPSVAKTATQAAVTDLSLNKMGIAGGIYDAPSLGQGIASDALSHVSWAKNRIKDIAGMSQAERAMRKRQYFTSDLDANVASMRSVSLVNKIRISRDVQFERSEVREKSYLEGVIAGLWT